jgi:FkbM family methyltransferase
VRASDSEGAPTAPPVQHGLVPIATFVPGAEPVRLSAYYAHMRSYYPLCEMQTKRWCQRMIGRDWHILDVGANIGYYAALFGRLAPEGRVVAYEPTQTAEMLAENLDLNGIDHVEIRRMALGAAEGQRREGIFRVWGSPAEVEEYPFSTVDAEMRALGWGRLDLLKIDVDSFDLEVLRGAAETLDRFNPFVLVELNHALAERGQGVADALDWLAGQGYAEALVLDRENFLLRRPEAGRAAATPGLCLRHDREPVYCPGTLVTTAEPAAEVGAPGASVVGTLAPEGAEVVIEGPAWSYGLIWPVSAVATGPAVVEVALEVAGSDVGVLCVGAGLSSRIGAEVILAPGPGLDVRIEIERIEEVAALVLRKGPGQAGAARVRFGAPTIRVAVLAGDADAPLSMNPARRDVALHEIASGLGAPVADLPDARLEIVEAHDLGRRLGFDFATRPPRMLIDTPLDQFRMETHDSTILAQLYRMIRPAQHLEFGTWEGFGTELCARNCDARIWTVNLPEGERDAAGRPLYGAGSDAGERIGRLYRLGGHGARVTQMLIDSRDFDAADFGPGFFDTVLIDGGHEAEVVASDTRNALRTIRAGGVVLWHDFCPDPEVLRRTAVARGVASAVLGNWQAWRGCLSDLFWIRPSWILCGVSNGRRPG